jgi:hypothetical protein
MRYLKRFNTLNEASVSTTTNLSEVEKIAKAQKYGFEKTESGGLAFSLKVNDTEYFVTLYSNGRFAVIKKSPKKEEIKGNWFTTPWGTTFEYTDKKGEKISSAGVGINAIDIPIAWGVLGKFDGWISKIKSSTGSFVPLTAEYSPSTEKCINPKSLNEISSGKCILTVGSSGDTVKIVQSSLNFVLSKEALDLLSGTIYNKDMISNLKEVNIDPDGKFGKITKGSVEEFQKLKGGMKVDGVVGKNTLANLIEVKDEITKKEKELLSLEIKELDSQVDKEDTDNKNVDGLEVDKKEEEDIESLQPIDIQIEIERTFRELRKGKKGSRKRRRLLRRLKRLQKREARVKDKIDKLTESSDDIKTDNMKHIKIYERFVDAPVMGSETETMIDSPYRTSGFETESMDFESTSDTEEGAYKVRFTNPDGQEATLVMGYANNPEYIGKNMISSADMIEGSSSDGREYSIVGYYDESEGFEGAYILKSVTIAE